MFIELTQIIISGSEIMGRIKLLINASKIKQISKNGKMGTLIEFGIEEYAVVEESYEYVKRRLLLLEDEEL